ncbi:MAG TPA: DoxX family protein [Tepidisphaeraceae bacterium]|jgi:hypothetical protein|nr:DoxX family protein [Tepidisphaeraceae bacterium]
MKLERASTAGSKVLLILGWVMTAIPILMMGVGGVYTLYDSAAMDEGLRKQGYAAHLGRVILYLEIACVIVYAFPRTAILGAILLTGYLGGAVATHVRAEDGMWPAPVVFGVIVWLGVFLRDARLRALIPWRR